MILTLFRGKNILETPYKYLPSQSAHGVPRTEPITTAALNEL